MFAAQLRMKVWFDRRAKCRSFSPGDTVLVFLPIPGSALQAHYRGPYVVQEKVSDREYVVATPEHRWRRRLCHIRMLKSYLDRGSVSSCADNIDKQAAVLLLPSADVSDGPSKG